MAVSKPKSFAALLMLSSALISPAAFAQDAAQETPPADQAADEPADESGDEIEISAPGGGGSDEIVVRGKFIPDPIRATPEVVSVLGEAEIARTAEGDIAGSLSRVTGLSLVGGRFVYVRGLGERYSSALMNGSPLPSPEPLRRVVPLDLFPTSIIASTVVQKSYSANFPGEFGGGLINLTTKSKVDEPFLNIGFGTGGDSETTFELGYTYFGSDSDFTGFDDGTRTLPAAFQRALTSGNPIIAGQNFTAAEIRDLTASLENANTTLIQRNRNIPANFSGELTGGTNFEIGDVFFSLFGTAGLNNRWRTRGGTQQVALGVTPGTNGGAATLEPTLDQRYLTTENRVTANGMLALNAEVGEHKFRFTNLFIRDTSKEASIRAGTDGRLAGIQEFNSGRTNWFARQLFTTQFVGEMNFDALQLDFRGSYAKSRRDAPYERTYRYQQFEIAPGITRLVNDLRTNGDARIAFSELDDNVYGAGVDLTYELPTARPITLTAGYSYYKNDRTSTRRDFRYLPVNELPVTVAQTRIDFLLSDFNVYNYDIQLVEIPGDGGVTAYTADLEVHAGYILADAELFDGVRVNLGVRYEDGDQSTTPIDFFNLGGSQTIPTRIQNDYWLPAGTITWNFADDMQLRLAASKTIARPQFRELAPQLYLDLESDRQFFGNQFLQDSELFNVEARYEWYFDRDQRISLAGFYKKIDNPIEIVAFERAGAFLATFANAPEATLYGAEIEVLKFFDLYNLGSKFFEERRLLASVNYTFTKSEIKADAGDLIIDPTGPAGATPVPASNIFRDGSRLTGQSKHIFNMQFGMESTGERLSQQTFLVSYNSPRVSNRGSSDLPDLIEDTGWRLDFVWREGFQIFKSQAEVKLEVRNILSENYIESQTLGTSRIINNFYDIGTSVSLGVELDF